MWPHRQQPTRLPRPWDSPGKNTGVSRRLEINYKKNRASLVAQMVQNLPARWETWVQSLAWENPLEEGMATCILAWRISMDRGAWRAALHQVLQSRTRLKQLSSHRTTLFNLLWYLLGMIRNLNMPNCTGQLFFWSRPSPALINIPGRDFSPHRLSALSAPSN